MNQLPSRSEVEKVFGEVLAGRMSREDAASWAMRFTETDWDPQTADYPVFVAIEELSGVDLREQDRTYLHSENDIRDWLNTLTMTPFLNSASYDAWFRSRGQ